jgi:hypothetical protein
VLHLGSPCGVFNHAVVHAQPGWRGRQGFSVGYQAGAPLVANFTIAPAPVPPPPPGARCRNRHPSLHWPPRIARRAAPGLPGDAAGLP